MAFVHVRHEMHDIYFPEHTVFWIEVKRSYDTGVINHMTTICGQSEAGVKFEQKFDGLPQFVPS